MTQQRSQTVVSANAPAAQAGGRNASRVVAATPARRGEWPPLLQAKLTISEPGDRYEEEADRVADQVMRMPDPSRIDPTPIRALSLQRRCAQCEEEELQRKTQGPQSDTPDSGLDSVAATLRGEGRPLDPATRGFFEPRFGVDFGGVRVHTDSQAAASARSVNALAYTVGRDVVFNAGQYAPESDAGRRLLAHELTHVVQQGAATSGACSGVLQRKDTPDAGQAAEEASKFGYNSGLDSDLRQRFNRMVIAMDRQGIGYGTIDDVRPIGRAHILSTAHHIHDRGGVSLDDLRALASGKDLDGNVWYKKEWETVSHLIGADTPANSAEIFSKAKDNAFDMAKSQGSGGYVSGNKVNCAYEGYAADDPHRKPNVAKVPISSHVTGHAIDLSSIQWNKLGGPWSDQAKAFVAGFGLTRPFSPEAATYCIKEPWHFELGAAPAKSDVPAKSDAPAKKEEAK